MKYGLKLKTTAVVLLVCIFVCGFSFKTEAVYPIEYPRRYESGGFSAIEVLSQYTDTEELRAYLFEQFKSCPTYVDVRSFGIPVSAFDAVQYFIWREIPESFHVNGLGASTNGTTILKIAATYAYTASEYAEMLAECEETAAGLAAGIADNDSLSDVEKALFLHDRLAVSCEYNYNTADDDRYLMYGALGKHTAVCDGYSKAYSYLLRLAGIESLNCSSDDLNHSWNLVKIDGIYYHVDVTWDDPSIKSGARGINGYVRHTNFMRSNDGIKATGHDATDYYAPAYDTRYDDYFWQSSETEFQLVNGEIYYIDNAAQNLMHYDFDTNTATSLLQVDDRWKPNATSYWSGNFSRLSSDGTFLLFTLTDTVYRYDPKTTGTETLYKPQLEGYDAIYGFTLRDGNMIIDISDRPAGSVDRLRQIIEPYKRRIAVEWSVSADVSPTQILTVDILSETGISGYYFEKNTYQTQLEFIPSTNSHLELPVKNSGTYCFTAVDGNNKKSETVSISFYSVKLTLRNGNYPCNEILVAENSPVTLSDPVREHFTFNGWATTNLSNTGTVGMTIDDPAHTPRLFATWLSNKVISGTVFAGGSDAVIYIYVSGSDEPDVATVNGEFSIEVSAHAEKIAVTANGYVTRIYDLTSTATNIDVSMSLEGDVDSDGKLNNKDVARLFKYISGRPVMINEAASDVNADGKINNKDVVLLFGFVSGTGTKLNTLPVNQ